MDTSVPGQQDASDAALVDMLMLEAPVGLALFGADLRFRWVNAALTRLAGEPARGVRGDGVSPKGGPGGWVPPEGGASTDPSGWTGQLPSEAWPEHVAVRAEAALRKVLEEGLPLAERGYPVMSTPAGAPGATASSSGAPAEDVCGCASWFPVHDAAGKVFGAGLIMLNVAGLSTEAAETAAAEIRRSEERYRSLVQGGAQVVWVAAPDGAMKEDSAEWRWITGQSEEEYSGFGWLE